MKSNIGQLSFYWLRNMRLHQFRFAVILKRPLKSFTLIFFKMCLLRSLRCDLTFSQWVDKWHFQASTVNNRKFSSASILNINNFLRLFFFFSTENLKTVMPIRCPEDAGNCFIPKKAYILIPLLFSCTSLMFLQAQFSFCTVGIKNIQVSLILLLFITFFSRYCKIATL